MSDDHKGPTSHRRRRSGIDSVSGKCVVCASSIVAGIAGVGLSWLPASGLPGTAPPTRFGEIELIDSSDPLASLENLVIVLPGADDTVVLPSDNVINLPFGGDGLNNFFGPGEVGAAGGTADIATGQTWDEFTTPVDQITIPFLNDTIVLPGSADNIVFPSFNTIDLPFGGDGENNFFGGGNGGDGGVGTGIGGNSTDTADGTTAS